MDERHVEGGVRVGRREVVGTVGAGSVVGRRPDNNLRQAGWGHAGTRAAIRECAV